MTRRNVGRPRYRRCRFFSLLGPGCRPLTSRPGVVSIATRPTSGKSLGSRSRHPSFTNDEEVRGPSRRDALASFQVCTHRHAPRRRPLARQESSNASTRSLITRHSPVDEYHLPVHRAVEQHVVAELAVCRGREHRDARRRAGSGSLLSQSGRPGSGASASAITIRSLRRTCCRSGAVSSGYSR
jgi:hypothetical protein